MQTTSPRSQEQIYARDRGTEVCSSEKAASSFIPSGLYRTGGPV